MHDIIDIYKNPKLKTEDPFIAEHVLGQKKKFQQILKNFYIKGYIVSPLIHKIKNQ